ncbi:MAG: hypothetical protein GX972_09145 [Amphibacillus sp.]|nr:hypothetical protein [Amphibacillus sp.]
MKFIWLLAFLGLVAWTIYSWIIISTNNPLPLILMILVSAIPELTKRFLDSEGGKNDK